MSRCVPLLLLAACGVEPRAPTPSGLPDGVWEPDPGVQRRQGTLVAAGNDVWFAYTRDGDVWLAKTSSSGDVLVEPVRVEAGGAPALAATADSLSLAFDDHTAGTLHVRQRDLARGDAIGASVDVAGLPGGGVFRIVAHDNGQLAIVSTVFDSTTADVIATTIDSSASASTMTIANDESAATAIAAAKGPDGTTLFAWARSYDICSGDTRSGQTFVSSVQGASVTTPISVADTAGITESDPALASAGNAAYVAWIVDLKVRSSLSLARFADVTVRAAEVGTPTQFNVFPRLALSGDRAGAIAWTSYGDFERTRLNVASLVDDGTTITIGPVHSFGAIDPYAPPWMNELVWVGDDRFVFGWNEGSDSRFYARVVDLSQAPRALPPAPPVDQRSAIARLRPCSH